MRTYNINKTYVDKNDRKYVILTTAVFTIFSTENRLKYHSPGQLVLGYDIILPKYIYGGLGINTSAKASVN